MNKELIERMKNNRVPNCLLTDEEWECLKAANKWQWLPQPGAKWLDTHANTNRRLNVIHRIHPDYNPEPERKVVKREVKIDGEDLCYFHKKCWYSLCQAMIKPKFIGFEYADGDICSFVRRSYSTDKPAEYPKYVLFSEVQE